MEFLDISMLIKLFMGALATFFAILLWSKTRDTAWILISIGTVVFYVEIIFSTLNDFGILEEFRLFGLFRFDILSLILINLPILLYTIAFIIVILRRRN
jgi:hypothetical protein